MAWAGFLALCLAVWLGAWPAVWRWVVLPQAGAPGLGLALAAPAEAWRTERAQAVWDRPHSVLAGVAVWRVERPGPWRLELTCDDHGALGLDRRLLIKQPALDSPGQTAATEIYLTSGSHFLELAVTNRGGQGRFVLAGAPVGSPLVPLGDGLQVVELGNLPAWLAAVRWLERAALLGLALGGAWFLLLLALWSPRRLGQPPPRGRAAWAALVLAVALAGGWGNTASHVHWLRWAVGPQVLATQEWDLHQRALGATPGGQRDHRDYRLLSALPSRALLDLARTRGDLGVTKETILYGYRWLLDALVLFLAAVYYRRLGLSRPAALLGLGLLIWACQAMRIRASLYHSDYLDFFCYLAAGVMILERRWSLYVPLAGLAALNRETALLIPLLPLAATVSRRPWGLTVDRGALWTTLASLALAGAVFLGLRWWWEGGVFTKANDQPGWFFIAYNLWDDPDAWRNLYYTWTFLPLVALWALWRRRTPAFLTRISVLVMPAFALVMTVVAYWAEPRAFLVPLGLCLVPAALCAVAGPPAPEPVNQQAAANSANVWLKRGASS